MQKLLELMMKRCDHPLDKSCPHPWARLEEQISSLIHLIGFFLGIVALVLMVVFSSLWSTPTAIVSTCIFGASLVFAYGSSTLYHFVTHARLKLFFRKMDHLSIYLLIAGTYTPVVLSGLQGAWGWSLFGSVWGIAVLGFIFKFTRWAHNIWLSTGLYVLMGWMVVVGIVPLVHALPTPCLVWLVIGGVSYTLGVIFFMLETVPYMHVVWHVFVLGGSIAHFIAVMFYVIPLGSLGQ